MILGVTKEKVKGAGGCRPSEDHAELLLYVQRAALPSGIDFHVLLFWNSSPQNLIREKNH